MRQRRRGFTLVEMLVVLGIIVLLAGMLVPALMHVRRASRQTACASNLREIGQLVVIYADANHDLLPMGHTAIPADGEPVQTPDGGWQTSIVWTSFLMIDGVPSCNLGPLWATGAITAEGSRMLYCPTDTDERIAWRLWRDKFPAVRQNGLPGTTIRISYFGRLVGDEFRHTLSQPPNVQMFWPLMLPRLSDLKHQPLFSDFPGRPANHGTDGSPLINVLYEDGSVQLEPAPMGDGEQGIPYQLPPKPTSPGNPSRN